MNASKRWKSLTEIDKFLTFSFLTFSPPAAFESSPKTQEYVTEPPKSIDCKAIFRISKSRY